MTNSAIRSLVVLVLLFGTFALAVPQISSIMDQWLFASEAEKHPKQHTKIESHGDAAHSTPESPRELDAPERLAPPTPIKARDLKPLAPANKRAGAHAPPPATAFRGSDFAFDYHEPSTPSLPAIARTSFTAPVPVRPVDTSNLKNLQKDLQALGADYIIVEELENGVYECRCLVPLPGESNYQKAMSAQASDPSDAMRGVIEQLEYFRSAIRSQRKK